MKAIRLHRFGGPEVLRLEDLPTPQAGPGQVLVHARAIGVNPVDTYFRSGTNPAIQPPWTPGLDAAGEVETVGDGVRHVRAGERVYTGGSVTGAYAEFILCTAAQVHPLPAHVSFEQGAGIGVPYATAWRALFDRGRARPGEVVFIHGASGGVGTAAVQIARAAGLTIIGTGGPAEGRKLVAEQGAHHVLDHRDANYLEQALALTGGRGVDLILEMLANVNLGKDLPLLARHGRVVIIGSRGKVEITPRDLMSRDADIRALSLFNATEAELAAIHTALGAGLENRSLRPIVGKTMPLAEAAKAHEAVLAPGAHGKIVLVP